MFETTLEEGLEIIYLDGEGQDLWKPYWFAGFSTADETEYNLCDTNQHFLA